MSRTTLRVGTIRVLGAINIRTSGLPYGEYGEHGNYGEYGNYGGYGEYGEYGEYGGASFTLTNMLGYEMQITTSYDGINASWYGTIPAYTTMTVPGRYLAHQAAGYYYINDTAYQYGFIPIVQDAENFIDDIPHTVGGYGDEYGNASPRMLTRIQFSDGTFSDRNIRGEINESNLI